MKIRYKALLIIAAITGIALLNVWAGVITTIFFMAWCVVNVGKSVNDDAMMDEEQYTDQKKSKVMVAPDGEIEWGAVRP